MPRSVSSSDNVGAVTARMEMLLSTKASSSSRCTYAGPEIYDLYLMERICCEAEENDDDASHRLEAAYLSSLREILCEDQVHPIGTKRRERSLSTPSVWLPRSSTTTPTSVAMMDASMLMSNISVTGAASTSSTCVNGSGSSPSKRSKQHEEEKTPELNAWARAAAEQAAASSKRARREFWKAAEPDLEKLRGMTLS